MIKLLMLLLTALLLPFAACAEEAFPTEQPTEPPAEQPILFSGGQPATFTDLGETPLPLVLDRVNQPGIWPDYGFDEDAELLEVIYPQIFDCDSVLIRCGGETLMIDCGTVEEVPRIIRMCELYGVRHIDRLLITHAHHDHIGGLRRLLLAVHEDAHG